MPEETMRILGVRSMQPLPELGQPRNDRRGTLEQIPYGCHSFTFLPIVWHDQTFPVLRQYAAYRQNFEKLQAAVDSKKSVIESGHCCYYRMNSAFLHPLPVH